MTDFPCCAMAIAAERPFGPEPITIASYGGDWATFTLSFNTPSKSFQSLVGSRLESVRTHLQDSVNLVNLSMLVLIEWMCELGVGQFFFVGEIEMTSAR